MSNIQTKRVYSSNKSPQNSGGNNLDLQQVTENGNSTTEDVVFQSPSSAANITITQDDGNNPLVVVTSDQTGSGIDFSATLAPVTLSFSDLNNSLAKTISVGNYTNATLTLPDETGTFALREDHAGGQSPFTADGIITVFDITHNLGQIPSYFSLTTTEPISGNHLNRTITFPDNNTMRITFGVAPNPGEDANYVWIVYK